MHSLPLFAKIDGQPVLLIGTGEAADAKRRLIERAGGVAVPENDPRAAQARIAFIALDDEAEAQTVASRLKAAGKLVNVVDRPALCDFTTPAIVDRDPVVIAVSSGGTSAGLAKAVRQRIEALLPAQLGSLSRALQAARTALRARFAEPAARRRALDAALAPGGPLDPLMAHGEDAVPRWLERADLPPADRTEVITLVSADPDDLTLRAARLLGEADRVVHPAETPRAILARARADAQRVEAAADALWPDAPGLTVRIVISAR